MSRRDSLAIALLAAACLLFFGPALFGDRAVFTWNMDVWHPWKASASADEIGRPTRGADCPRQFFIMRHISREAIREGRIPLWNKWIYAGTPFLANFQPGVFYPPNLLLNFTPLTVLDQMSWSMAFHFFVAASGAFALLRMFGVGIVGALAGAAVCTWSGFNIARTGIHTMPVTGSWLPWVLVATKAWFDRGRARAFVGMSGSLALSGLAGFFQIFVFTGYAFLFFGLVLGLYRTPRLPWRRWAGFVIAGIVALLLVCIQLIPTIEFAQRSQETDNSRDELISGTIHPWALGKLVIPDLLGNPVDHTNATHHLKVGNGFYYQTEHSTAVYVGIFPLLLAGTLLLSPGDRRRETFFALALMGFGLLFCLPSPVLEGARFLPGLNFSRPDRATFLFCFGAGLVAGLGVDRIASKEGTGWWRPANAIGIFTGVLFLLFIVVMAVAGDRLLPGGVVRTVGSDRLRFAELLALATVLASTLLLAARTSGKLSGRAFAVSALVLLSTDVGWVASKLNIMHPKEAIFRAPRPGGSIEFLQRAAQENGPFRIMRYEPSHDQFQGAFPPSTPAYYGIEDVLGFDSLNSVLYQEIVQTIDPKIILNRGNFKGTKTAGPLASPLLDLLGARYILAMGSPDLDGFPKVHDSDLSLYENPDALPRAFFVDRVEVLASDGEVLQALANPAFDPGKIAYARDPVEGLSHLAATDAPPDPAAPDNAAAQTRPRVLSYDCSVDETSRVRVETSRPAFLVVSDAWDPGWFVRVNGKARTLHRVDHAFRGVAVEPGETEVVFHYAPPAFRWGLWCSLLGIVSLGLAGLAFRGKREPSFVD